MPKKPESWWDRFIKWLDQNSNENLRHGAYGQGWMGSRPLFSVGEGRTYPIRGTYGQPQYGWGNEPEPRTGGFAYGPYGRQGGIAKQQAAQPEREQPNSNGIYPGWVPLYGQNDASLQGDLNAATDQLIRQMRLRRVAALTGQPIEPSGGGGGGWNPTMNRWGQAYGSPGPLQQHFGGPGYSRGGQRVTNRYWTDERIQRMNLSKGKIGASLKAYGPHRDKNPYRKGQPMSQPEQQQPGQQLNPAGYWQNELINWRV